MRNLNRAFIDDLLSRIDIVQVINDRVKLKQQGNSHKGLCPFHAENTPSFNVSSSKQFYHCFGCGASGDVIKFLQEYEGLTFIEAIEKGVQFMINHPDESWRLFIKGHVNLNDELNKRAWRDTLPRFALRPAAFDKKRYKRFAEFLKKQGLIKNVKPVTDYAIELQ